jgi:PKD repeat protein
MMERPTASRASCHTLAIAAVSCVLFLTTLSAATSAQLDADFTGTPTMGVNPVTVSFTDTTTGGTPLVWVWDFGDGGTSSEQNPTHTYFDPGSYTVKLSVFPFLMQDVETKEDYITVESFVDFSASLTQGGNPLVVDFTDTSTGPTVTAWTWDFGDGTSSTLQNPTHTYEVAATSSFTVSLTVFFEPSQSDTLVKTNYITVESPLVVDFAASPAQGVNPLVVDFTDTSTGETITAWNWTFGDGNTSTLQSPTHIYQVAQSTTFTVSLTVFVGQPGNTLVKTDFISVDPAPLAIDFTATPAQGANPLQVAFDDTSTGATTTGWIWSFGDGGSFSVLQSPTHTYTAPGSYTVSLSAFVGPQVDMLVKTDLITVDPAPLIVDFTATPAQGINPLQVAFTDTSTGATTTAWSWDFGDGNSSTQQNPTQTYTLPGSYTVSLTAFVGQQSETLVKTDYITVDPAPLIAGFDASPTQGFNPLQVAFTDTSTGAMATSWHWEFGDGFVSVQQDPSHTYTTPGTYMVSLTTFWGPQSDTLVKGDFITVDPAPLVVDFTGSPAQGSLP